MGEYFGAPAHLRRDPSNMVSAQERCDAIQAEFRAEVRRPSIRREPPPLPAALVPTDDELSLRLAGGSSTMRAGCSIRWAIACPPIQRVLMRHSVPLQSVDIVGQILGHIAAVIRSSDPGRRQSTVSA